MRRALIILLTLVLGASSASAQTSRDASLRGYLQNQYRQLGIVVREVRDVRYAVAWVDLNGDGREEAVVHSTGLTVCGTGGCGLDILSRTRQGWRAVGAITPTRLPIRLLPGRSHGWRDIGVFVAGGGISPGYHARLSFDGRAYPSEPSVAPAQRLRTPGPGRVLISERTPTVPLFGTQRRRR